jgi:hypothetical protein
MKRLALGFALTVIASAANADWELRPTPDSGNGPIFTMWKIDTTGQQRTQLCEFYRSSYTYQTGADGEFTVTVERSGSLEDRFRRCLSATFKDE